MRYAFMIKPYVICIKNGLRKIDDVRPDELKQAVIKALAMDGLGPDGKPLKVEEPKEDAGDNTGKEGETESKEDE